MAKGFLAKNAPVESGAGAGAVEWEVNKKVEAKECLTCVRTNPMDYAMVLNFNLSCTRANNRGVANSWARGKTEGAYSSTREATKCECLLKQLACRLIVCRWKEREESA